MFGAIITKDTSQSISGFEAINLLTNLDNRSCNSSFNPFTTPATSASSAVASSQSSCFKTDESMITADGDIFILGIELPHSVTIHAVIYSEDQRTGDSW